MTQKLYLFFTGFRVNRCKCLIEHSKLYRFFTKNKFLSVSRLRQFKHGCQTRISRINTNYFQPECTAKAPRTSSHGSGTNLSSMCQRTGTSYSGWLVMQEDNIQITYSFRHKRDHTQWRQIIFRRGRLAVTGMVPGHHATQIAPVAAATKGSHPSWKSFQHFRICPSVSQRRAKSGPDPCPKTR